MRQPIYVVTAGGKWGVKCKHCNKKSAVTGTQAAAIRLAKLHVSKFPKGTLSQILVQGKDSKFRAEWTYGKDPFPPQG
jgi:predicted regulator of Ras-like GTPase activity (Roadblock/LC7/MglB family)